MAARRGAEPERPDQAVCLGFQRQDVLYADLAAATAAGTQRVEPPGARLSNPRRVAGVRHGDENTMRAQREAPFIPGDSIVKKKTSGPVLDPKHPALSEERPHFVD